MLKVPGAAIDGGSFSLWGSGECWMFLAAQSMAVGTLLVRWVSKYSDPVMATGWVGFFNLLCGAMVMTMRLVASATSSRSSMLSTNFVLSWHAGEYRSFFPSLRMHGFAATFLEKYEKHPTCNKFFMLLLTESVVMPLRQLSCRLKKLM